MRRKKVPISGCRIKETKLTQDAYAGKVIFSKLTPQALVEATNTVIGICSALSVGYTIEEVAIVGSLLPHALHFSATWLEVSKILLSQTGLLVDFDAGPTVRRGLGIVRGQGGQDALSGLSCAAIWRREEVEGVVWPEQLAQAAARFMGLGPAILRELHTMIGDCLVYIAILWHERSGQREGRELDGSRRQRTVALGLGMADEDDQSRLGHGDRSAHVRLEMLRLKMGNQIDRSIKRNKQILIGCRCSGGGRWCVWQACWWDDILVPVAFQLPEPKHPLSRNRAL